LSFVLISFLCFRAKNRCIQERPQDFG